MFSVAPPARSSDSYHPNRIHHLLPYEEVVFPEPRAGAEETHPIFGKVVAFSGDLAFLDRQAALNLVARAGGVARKSVTLDTDFLVIGMLSPATERAGKTKSALEEKAIAYNARGENIQFLNEVQFLELVDLDWARENDINREAVVLEMQAATLDNLAMRDKQAVEAELSLRKTANEKRHAAAQIYCSGGQPSPFQDAETPFMVCLDESLLARDQGIEDQTLRKAYAAIQAHGIKKALRLAWFTSAAELAATQELAKALRALGHDN